MNNFLSRRKRIISMVTLFSMIISVLFIGNKPTEVKAVYLDYISDNQYYYIKNVRSGKYMTVQHNQIVEGQNIVQWNFTGANNQKWRLEYAGNSSGNYRFLAYNTNLALSMASVSVESGIQAKLASKANDSRQLMYPTDELGNG